MAREERKDDDLDLPEGMVPLPREYRRGPGGCGFSGCMYAVMIFFALALAAMVILALTRNWPTPAIPGRP
ncbi:MAG TPA: hypothetical protein VNP72_06510 [Longimicrobium sp.]|nr:hypothetical protein [Longimicrobium sp.]